MPKSRLSIKKWCDYEWRVIKEAMNILRQRLGIGHAIFGLLFTTLYIILVLNDKGFFREHLYLNAIPYILLVVFYSAFYHRVASAKLDKEKGELIEFLQNELTEIRTPHLIIEHDENNLKYYHESYYELPTTTEELFSTMELKKYCYFRLCRIIIHNCSNVLLKNVEVKLTDISPLPHNLRGTLGLNLHYMHDNNPLAPRRFENINPDGRVPVDVIQFNWDYKENPYYSIPISNQGVNTNFAIPSIIVTKKVGERFGFDFSFKEEAEITYKIKITITAENSASVIKEFEFGLKQTNNDETKKLYLWSIN